MNKCEHPDCDQVRLVGWGKPPVWLCQQHFEEQLRALGLTIKKVRDSLKLTQAEGMV